MKKIMISALLLWSPMLMNPVFKPVDEGSAIRFKIKNFGISTEGSFSGLEGDIFFEKDHLNTAKFDVSVDANTINTGNETRDNHLRKEGYFDVQHYPRIRFISTRVTASSKPGVLYIFGTLNIKNHIQDVSFPFTATPARGGYLFTGNFKLNRRDFEVGGTSVISDSLEVDLRVLTSN